MPMQVRKAMPIFLILISIFICIPYFSTVLAQQQKPQEMTIDNVDFTGIPRSRTIEIKDMDFTGYPSVREIAFKDMDFEAIQRTRTIQINGVDFTATPLSTQKNGKAQQPSGAK